MENGAVDRWWAWRHSLWCFWLPTILFSWVAFVYIGLRVGRPRWVGFGLVYAVPLLMLTIFSDAGPGLSSIEDIAAGAMIVSGLAACVHGWAARPEFLLRLRNAEKRLEHQLAAELIDEAEGESSVTRSVPLPALGEVIDLNSANEEALALLPGVGVMGAEVAIKLRLARGRFHSVEDFGEALGLSENLIERLRSQVACSRHPHTERE